jgi:hypothetical protein
MSPVRPWIFCIVKNSLSGTKKRRFVCNKKGIHFNTADRLDQGLLHTKLEVLRLTCLGRELNPGPGRHALYQKAIQRAYSLLFAVFGTWLPTLNVVA